MFEKLGKTAKELGEALKEAFFFVLLAMRAFKFWHRESPIVSLADLTRFVETRSKFVAQITLFGYIKTRAGTRYTLLFADETYARSINIAKWEIYLASLADLAVYAVAVCGREAGASDDEMRDMAIHIVGETLNNEEIPKERPQGYDDIRKTFDARARTCVWEESAKGEAAFGGSLEALVHWAPIADELKQYDVEIVKNSMRFRWKKVRDDMAPLLDAAAVMADWRNGGAIEAASTNEAPTNA